MDGIVIERVHEGEWEKLKEIRLRSLRLDPNAFGSTFEFESGQPDGYWKDWAKRAEESRDRITVLARKDGLPVGIGGGISDGTDVELVAIWVDPSLRGNGIARGMIKCLRGLYPSMRFCLWVNTRNESAINCYAKIGFRDSGERQNLKRDSGISEMRMDLSS